MLRKKEKYLTSHEMKILDEAKKKYEQAFKKRDTNPSDFDTNIMCLKDLAEACHDWMAVATSHLTEKKIAEVKVQTSRFQFFRDHANDKMLKQATILNEAKNYMLADITPIIKAYFLREPRITNLSFNENHITNTNSKKKLIGSQDKEEYKISFSDGSNITLTNLNQDSLAQAKITFTDKMNELARISEPASENRIRLN